MNIFYVDSNPIIAAQNLVDKHVVKMIVETAQLLCTAHFVLDKNSNEELYKPTHKNHPSAKWVRESNKNYEWLYEHFVALLNEYTFRYGKIHKTSRLKEILKNPPLNISKIHMTNISCAMPNEFKISNDSIINYRQYYKFGKQHLHKWTKREKPKWIENDKI